MRSLRLALICVLVTASAAGCVGTKDGSDAIRDLLDREVRAINAKDLNALSEIWAQDDQITLFDVPPPGRFQGWKVIGHQWKAFFGQFSEIHMEAGMVRIEMAGGTAWATYDWTLTGKMGDRALADRGQATAIYRRGEEGWRLVHAHYSPAPPATAEAAPAGTTAPAGTAAPKETTAPAGTVPPAPAPAKPAGS